MDTLAYIDPNEYAQWLLEQQDAEAPYTPLSEEDDVVWLDLFYGEAQ